MRTHLKFLGYLLVFSFVTSTSIFWTFEYGVNQHIKSYGDVLWWWVVTSSTVGYGDTFPITLYGRIGAVIAILIGIYVYTNFVTITAEKIALALDAHKMGTAKISCKNHIVICEYTAFADELIQEINFYPELKNREVVIVSDLINKNPYLEHFFVSGVPINPDSLKRANIEHAEYIFVFSNIRFKDPDLKTLHIVSRIQKLNKHAVIFIELTNPESEIVKKVAMRSNEVIIMETNRLLESVIVNSSIDLKQFINGHKQKDWKKIPV